MALTGHVVHAPVASRTLTVRCFLTVRAGHLPVQSPRWHRVCRASQAAHLQEARSKQSAALGSWVSLRGVHVFPPRPSQPQPQLPRVCHCEADRGNSSWLGQRR